MESNEDRVGFNGIKWGYNGDLKIHNESLTFGLSMMVDEFPMGDPLWLGNRLREYGSFFGGSGSAVHRKEKVKHKEKDELFQLFLISKIWPWTDHIQNCDTTNKNQESEVGFKAKWWFNQKILRFDHQNQDLNGLGTWKPETMVPWCTESWVPVVFFLHPLRGTKNILILP